MNINNQLTSLDFFRCCTRAAISIAGHCFPYAASAGLLTMRASSVEAGPKRRFAVAIVCQFHHRVQMKIRFRTADKKRSVGAPGITTKRRFVI